MIFGRIFKLKYIIILSLLNAPIIYYLNTYITYINQRLHKRNIYDIDTLSCRIPHISPFEKQFLAFVKKGELECKMLEPLVISNDTHLIINKNASTIYNVTENVVCCYKSLERKIPEGNSTDNLVSYGEEEVLFSQATVVRDEYVCVKCFENETVVYTDYFSFVPLPEVFNSSKSQENKLNVLIIGIDSVSRHHFHRQMPKTLDYLKNDLNAIEYLGYHKVGDNSFPNLIPVFTGKHAHELTDCWPNAKYRFDNCTFIWQKFHEKGYATSYAEEESWMGLFHYEKLGFINQPTTHYWGAFNFEMTQNLGKYSINHSTSTCLNERPAVEYILDYTLKFINSYKRYGQNFFATFWECSITHERIYYYPQFDSTYRKHLQDINDTGILNNTILFFMSDHGLRYGEELENYLIRFQQNLPVMFIVLPNWFKRLYPKASSNIRENARKLTSHFDLYETLQAIVDQKYNDENNFTRGISLFQPIPEDRNCKKAGIPAHFCCCQSSSSVDLIETVVINISNFILDCVNKLLGEYKQCARLYLNKIIYARVFSLVDEDIVYKYYTVSIMVQPSGAILESTVRCSKCLTGKDFHSDGPITRLNMYGQQSKCVNDAILKLYCYCY